MQTKERITLNDSIVDAVVKLVEGNPGATNACMEMVSVATACDPDSALGPWGNLFALDTLGIYGPRIWMLYSDVCGRNSVTAIGLLRCHQMGLLTGSHLQHVIDNRGRLPSGELLDIGALLEQLREKLPNFRFNLSDEPACK